MDIGNSLVKLAVFDGGRLVAQTSTKYLQPSVFEEILPGRRAERAIVESTRGDADEILSERFYVLTPNPAAGYKQLYTFE